MRSRRFLYEAGGALIRALSAFLVAASLIESGQIGHAAERAPSGGETALPANTFVLGTSIRRSFLPPSIGD
jgi:hypothetical protein